MSLVPVILAADAGWPISWQYMLLLAGLALVTSSLLMRISKRRRRQALEPTSLEKVEQMRQVRGMRGDLEGLMVEIEQMAKRLGAQLDAKAVQLEQLLEEADRKLGQLRAEPGATASAATPVVAEKSAQPDDPLARSVYALADQGVEPQRIARELNEHVGKVELILALRSA